MGKEVIYSTKKLEIISLKRKRAFSFLGVLFCFIFVLQRQIDSDNIAIKYQKHRYIINEKKRGKKIKPKPKPKRSLHSSYDNLFQIYVEKSLLVSLLVLMMNINIIWWIKTRRGVNKREREKRGKKALYRVKISLCWRWDDDD